MNASRAILAICLLLSGCSSCGPREQSSAGGTGGSTTNAAPPAAAAPGKVQVAPPQPAGMRQPNAPAPAAEAGAPAAAPQAGDAADCVVVADVNPDFGPPPLAVTFTAEAECGQGPTYKWDFGDGSSPSTEANPTHTYTKDGDYTASVTVTGPNGATSSDEIDIFVEQD
jgi:PKD repeat protein